MKKKMLILALTLTAIVGAAATTRGNEGSMKEMASNYIVVVRHWFTYRTYAAPVVVYRPRYYVATPVYSYSYTVPVYRYRYYLHY